MKRVVIIRHAKSVPYGYEDDYNRDLLDRGKNDAKLLASELNEQHILPDIIISSPAKRALKTARIFAKQIHFPAKQIIEIEDLYEGLTTNEFLGLIQELPAECKVVFFFGHNPGFFYFVNNLLENFNGEMPTCSTVGIDFNVNSWENVEARSGKKAFHLTPKMLK